MRSPLECREDVASLENGKFRGSRAAHVHVNVSTVFHRDSSTTDALRQVRSTGKREDSLCLFLRSLRSCKSSDSRPRWNSLESPFRLYRFALWSSRSLPPAPSSSRAVRRSSLSVIEEFAISLAVTY